MIRERGKIPFIRTPQHRLRERGQKILLYSLQHFCAVGRGCTNEPFSQYYRKLTARGRALSVYVVDLNDTNS